MLTSGTIDKSHYHTNRVDLYVARLFIELGSIRKSPSAPWILIVPVFLPVCILSELLKLDWTFALHERCYTFGGVSAYHMHNFLFLSYTSMALVWAIVSWVSTGTRYRYYCTCNLPDMSRAWNSYYLYRAVSCVFNIAAEQIILDAFIEHLNSTTKPRQRRNID